MILRTREFPRRRDGGGDTYLSAVAVEDPYGDPGETVTVFAWGWPVAAIQGAAWEVYRPEQSRGRQVLAEFLVETGALDARVAQTYSEAIGRGNEQAAFEDAWFLFDRGAVVEVLRQLAGEVAR